MNKILQFGQKIFSDRLTWAFLILIPLMIAVGGLGWTITVFVVGFIMMYPLYLYDKKKMEQLKIKLDELSHQQRQIEHQLRVARINHQLMKHYISNNQTNNLPQS